MSRDKIVGISLFAFGLVVPFIDTLVILEAFLLTIPIILLFFGSAALFVAYLIWDRVGLRKHIIGILAIPIFIAAQVISTRAVDKIQRFRCESIIKTIEKVKNKTGQLPENYPVFIGIDFKTLENETGFKLSYSRGFMMSENYDSRDKTWRSSGWND